MNAEQCERLFAEYEQLEHNITRLRDFLDRFSGSEVFDQKLLDEQLAHMCDYSYILKRRIVNLMIRGAQLPTIKTIDKVGVDNLYN